MFLRTEQRPAAMEPVFLDPDKKGSRARAFEEKLTSCVVGQERAVRGMSSFYHVFLAGLTPSERPIGTMLLLGPTGSGKTYVVEKAAEALFGTSGAIIKIDCAEFQHSHEIAKLIGSPPGYLGHRETSPLLTQENLDRYYTEDIQLSILLFDEIEKASDSLWQLLLGILDKATLTLGDNRRVDFSHTLVVMTSNLGAREMSELISGGVGFAPARVGRNSSADTDQMIYRAALEAARRNFSPEFMNRIDKVVVFRSLQEQHLRKILDLELQALQNRIIHSDESFIFQCSDAVKEILLEEGIDPRYGARHLKRAIERILVYPLSNLIATGQVRLGDFVFVDAQPETEKLIFSRYRSADEPSEVPRPETASSRSNNISRLFVGGVYNVA